MDVDANKTVESPSAGMYTSRIEEIEKVLRGGFWMLRFPARLEKMYKLHHIRNAANAFRIRSMFILFLYILLASGIYSALDSPVREVWLQWYAWVGVIIVAAGILARISILDRWFLWYAGLGSFLSVAISVALTGVVLGEEQIELTQIAVMYAVIIIYCVVGLDFMTALKAGWLGGLAGAGLASFLGQEINWLLAHRSYTGGSFLAMCICYLMEHSDRRSYLQARLLTLTNRRTEKHAQHASELSRQDALTGLANRRSLDEHLSLLWRRSCRDRTSVALLMIDVDHFKYFNDEFGHQKGDQCLVDVAKVIDQFAGRADDLAARYGGEEFALILSGASLDDASLVANKLLAAVEALCLPAAGDRPFLTVSIGVAAIIPAISGEESELLRQSDEALYQAKRMGRNRVEISDESLTVNYK